jgi:hypothetical protein
VKETLIVTAAPLGVRAVTGVGVYGAAAVWPSTHFRARVQGSGGDEVQGANGAAQCLGTLTESVAAGFLHWGLTVLYLAII